jgi:excisionase family DNA binding protein
VEKKVLTLGEMADVLRVHPSTIYRLLKKKALPAYKVGRDWRINVEAFEQWRRNKDYELGDTFGSNNQARYSTAQVDD